MACVFGRVPTFTEDRALLDVRWVPAGVAFVATRMDSHDGASADSAKEGHRGKRPRRHVGLC